MVQRFKVRLYEIMDKASEGDTASRVFDSVIVTLILLNMVVVILESVEDLPEQYVNLLAGFETISMYIFAVEYLLRLWTCTLDERFQKLIAGRIKFVFSPLALADLIAILPFFLPWFFSVDLRFMRAIRLFRLFMVFKMGRYSRSLRTFGNVLRREKEELMVTMFVLFVILVIASGLMYFAENDAQPEVFSSIPATMWWGIVTLSTVGYGDAYPVTPFGKMLGAAIALMGVGMFALPAGILGSGFSEELRKRREEEGVICPHCGKSVHMHSEED